MDTNIVVSAFINPNGKPAKILRMVLSRKMELCHNSAILSEYEGVMLRQKFKEKIDSGNVRQFIDHIRSLGISFSPLPSRTILTDEADQIFYDTAVGSGSILISGNLKHFPKKPFIVSPADFLERLESGTAN